MSKNYIYRSDDDELSIVNNNIYIKNEKHENINYKNCVCLKPWGYEFLVYLNEKIGMWFLKIKKGESTSLHTHFNKDTIIIVLKGSAIINLKDKVLNLNTMSTIYLPHYKFHGLSSFSDETYLLEIEIYNDFTNFSDKNDLLRINDQYKRKITGYESSINTIKNNLDQFDFFYLDENFEKNIFDIKFKVIKIDNNTDFKNINSTHKILIDGKIFQNMNFYKEGSFLNNFDNIQFPNDNALILTLDKYYFEEDSKIIYDFKQLDLIVKELKNENKNIILTSGCFDIIHIGHLNTLKQAKKLGDILMVCLSSDEQIKLLKGKDRPINNYQDRIDLFKTINYVDYIILYDESNIEKEETLDNIMKIVDPKYWVKGNDYIEKNILEKHPHLKNIKLIKNIENKSTTHIINKIKNNL